MLSGLCKSIFITWHIIADQSGTGLWKHIPFCLTKLLKTKVGTQQRKNICNALNILLLGRLYSKQSRRLFILAPEPTSVHKYLKKHHWTSSLGSSQAKKKKKKSEPLKIYLLTTKCRLFRSTENHPWSVPAQHLIKKREIANICYFVTVIFKGTA